jgi:flagellin
MRINTNIAALNAQENMTNTNKSISSSLEKLSSGLKINKAADDASGLAIADKLRTQASSLSQGIANANSASALIQIADKAMAEQSNILDTVKTKLIQAATSTTSADGREAIRKDITKLLDQFDGIAKQTNYNGVTLLQRSATDTAKQDEMSFQLGEDKTFDVAITLSSASNTSGMGGGSEQFGAPAYDSEGVSITAASILTINSIGGTQPSGSAVTDNNIATDGAQQIRTNGEVTLASVSISSAGVEAADSTGMDFNLSGQIGAVVSDATIRMDYSNQTQAVKDTLAAIIGSNGNVASVAGSDGILSITASNSIDFKDLEFSAMRVFGNGLDNIAINDGMTGAAAATTNNITFTVENNIGGNNVASGSIPTPNAGQINVKNAAATVEMTGGRLLSELKNLDENGLTADLANDFMGTIDEALTQLNTNRADFGSTQNQLESSIRNMQTTHTNLKNAESVIRDTDYAAESANFNKQNIIAQAGTYAMSQANAMAQNVQRLLQ